MGEGKRWRLAVLVTDRCVCVSGGGGGGDEGKTVIMKGWGCVCSRKYCACLSRGGHACSTVGGGGGVRVSIETCCFDVTGFNKKYKL